SPLAVVINSPAGARVGSAAASSLPAVAVLVASAAGSAASGAGPQAAASRPASSSRGKINLDKARFWVKANSLKMVNSGEWAVVSEDAPKQSTRPICVNRRNPDCFPSTGRGAPAERLPRLQGTV